MKRIPIQSIAGANDADTETLRLLFYLVEVERQAEIFNRSLTEAIRTSLDTDDADDAWRHIQSALFAAIIIRRFVSDENVRADPKGEGSRNDRVMRARRAAAWRATRLRQLLGMTDDIANSPIFKVRELRNSLEHIEARIDAAYERQGTICIADWYLADGIFADSVEETADLPGSAGGMRGFDPESGFVIFDREPFNLFALDIELLKVKHNSRKAQAELMAGRRGRARFGNIQMRPSRGSSNAQLIERWRKERAALEADMNPPVPLNGVRVWMQVGDK